jgi:hypothetical protein
MTVTVYPDKEPEWMPVDPDDAEQYDSGWQSRGHAFSVMHPGTSMGIEGTTICELYASFEKIIGATRGLSGTFWYSAGYHETYSNPRFLNVSRYSLPPDSTTQSDNPADGSISFILTITSFQNLLGR